MPRHTASMSSVVPIRFPVLFRYGRSIFPSGPDLKRYWGVRHVRGNCFAWRDSVKPEARLTWLIDRDGLFREAVPVGVSLAWLRPIRKLWVFSKTLYELRAGVRLTVGELLPHVGGALKDPEKSSGGSFRRFLSRLPKDQIFTRELFLDYMHEPLDLVPESYPEESNPERLDGAQPPS